MAKSQWAKELVAIFGPALVTTLGRGVGEQLQLLRVADESHVVTNARWALSVWCVAALQAANETLAQEEGWDEQTR